jgi:hypothetical protein
MLLAIESFVRVFEDLLTGHMHTARTHRVTSVPAACNDNDDSDATTRRWAASRR